MKLNDSISKLPLVGPVYVRRLEKLNIFSIRNLFYHIPSRYTDFRVKSKIKNIQLGETVTTSGVVKSIINQYTKSRKKIQIAHIQDTSGEITAIWFNQPFLIRSIKKGTQVVISGRVDFFGSKKAFISPEYEIKKDGIGIHTGRLIPVYPETAGVSSKWLRGRITFAWNTLSKNIVEYLPKDVLKDNDLVDLPTAIKYLHFPETPIEPEIGKKRLAFEELLLIHLKALYKKLDWKKNIISNKIYIDKKQVDSFIKSLPFELTPSQKRTVDEILKDLGKKSPMNRLLQGDVGSGKTVVAALGCLVSFLNGYQSVIMAPTQILAGQHSQTIGQLFKNYKLRTSLITSAGVKKDAGRADIVIGTHALIHKKVDFANIGFVVIDEQHRFGVEQRAHLTKKAGNKMKAPHVLTMTATPIPRTIALTLYGDLDLSTLDELPKGRKKITTWLVPPQKREGAYTWIENQIRTKNIQAFIICPLIEESDKESMMQVRAAKAEYEKLKKVFAKLKLDLLHGRIGAKEKDKIIKYFKDKKTDILVSTPVVEVGIDIPEATIMMIEGAERFGLSQLHQLRGRVGRGEKKSYCLLFTDFKSSKIHQRLSAMQKTMSGFDLAELDLKLRGPGEIFGIRQHGFTELKAASWNDSKLISRTKKAADKVAENPKKYNKLIKYLKSDSIAAN